MSRLEKKLLNTNTYPHNVDEVEHIETHISHIFLAGSYAYKIKKSVNFGFLDFSTLEKRKYFCEEEIRINSRLSDSIYIDVVAIVSIKSELYILKNIEKDSSIVEYAVRMHRFPTTMELDKLLTNDSDIWQDDWIDEIALCVADFHKKAQVATIGSGYGRANDVFAYALDNYAQIAKHIQNKKIINTSNYLEKWTKSQSSYLLKNIKLRLENGFVRECHGDMHMANMVYWHKKVQIFDAIEFNSNLRWIDVISDISFVVMDLESRGREDLAWRFLNKYLFLTGDYSGLILLDFYRIYRATVRAKVAAIRYFQLNNKKDKSINIRQINHYLELANNYAQPNQKNVIMLNGLSASGKSTLAAELANILKAVWIRSDVERKRLFGLFDGISQPLLKGDMYTTKANDLTYHRLLDLSIKIIKYGYSVIVDATFLKLKERELFYKTLKNKANNIIVVNIYADKDVLRSRINSRIKKGDDVSDANIMVLEEQFNLLESLEEKETKDINVLHIDANNPLKPKDIANKVRKLKPRNQ